MNDTIRNQQHRYFMMRADWETRKKHARKIMCRMCGGKAYAWTGEYYFHEQCDDCGYHKKSGPIICHEVPF